MKRKIIGIFVCMLLFSTVAGTISSSEPSRQSLNKVTTSEGATHTVFGDYGTSTTCGYCKYAHGALKELYAEGQLDFYYVSLVCNKNSKAYARAKNDYNLYGYPTLWWDGGHRVNVGAGSIPSAKSAYKSSINYCGNRAVKDIDIDLTATWLGGTEMQIDVSVDNNEASTYDGTIRVYITEFESSKGWKDTAGLLYTFPFLDWAFNENISITAGGTWSDSTTWIGSANGFPGITEDNSMVIATVSNDEWHQGYSYPPSSKPFDAYYVDDTVGYRVGNNRPPNAPNIDGPKSGKIGETYNYTFTLEDPDWFDQLYLYIEWGDGNIEDWTGPYSPGEEVTKSHTWTSEGTFTIKAKAKDDSGAEGPEGTLEVSMPKPFNFNFNLLGWLFEQFPNGFPILRYFVGL
ncbi:MAG: hypothetical protein JSW60_05690 [Thermoplasmatales archaeon]|nr:MAG: hypothetical protein JSW60_05690 [Thermoplasmatales archaeon]